MFLGMKSALKPRVNTGADRAGRKRSRRSSSFDTSHQNQPRKRKRDAFDQLARQTTPEARSKKRKRHEDFTFEPRKRSKPSVEIIEDELEKMVISDHPEIEEEGRSTTTALVPASNSPKTFSLSKLARDIMHKTSPGNRSLMLRQPEPDPKVISAKVLQALCDLGCLEKVQAWGHDIHLVNPQNKLVPVFPKPVHYYFQKTGPRFRTSSRQGESPAPSVFVGLWLLLVQLGTFVPFPLVKSLYPMFVPEVNVERLFELGTLWLKQLGLREEDLPNMNMDLLLEKLVRAVQDSQGRFLEQDPDAMDTVYPEIEEID